MRSNCALWAWLLYLRRTSAGFEGYIALRRSRWGPFPHFLYCERRPHGRSWRVVSYVPQDPHIRTCPPPLFAGRIKWGDGEQSQIDKGKTTCRS